ncbi:proline-rich protein 12 [Lates japonicus]|uniref:Proline-rich protein 12 n=1 Tax=Lates japonicus TaxID=270547 RepID=A0AAD3QZ98_LATJO|nr:proline-rich protein 12 [Lates japonicus]
MELKGYSAQVRAAYLCNTPDVQQTRQSLSLMDSPPDQAHMLQSPFPYHRLRWTPAFTANSSSSMLLSQQAMMGGQLEGEAAGS